MTKAGTPGKKYEAYPRKRDTVLVKVRDLVSQKSGGSRREVWDLRTETGYVADVCTEM